MPASIFLRRLCWLTLGWTLAVVVFGAYVRATKSGDGCGAHWPICNGQIVPVDPSLRTIVEFTHRATSGFALIASVGLLVLAFRQTSPGSLVRRGATLGVVFMLLEALVGAVLVKTGWVASNESAGRAIVMSIHLVNTFLLIAVQVLTVFWAHGGGALKLRQRGAGGALMIAALVGVVMLGVSGAVTALGDTLYPTATLAEGLEKYRSPFAQVLLPLRLLHPVIALFIGALLFAAAMSAHGRGIKKPVYLLGGAFVLQLGVGLLNVALLAPVWVQLLHLFAADLVWIALVYLAAQTLSQPLSEAPATVSVPQPA